MDQGVFNLSRGSKQSPPKVTLTPLPRKLPSSFGSYFLSFGFICWFEIEMVRRGQRLIDGPNGWGIAR